MIYILSRDYGFNKEQIFKYVFTQPLSYSNIRKLVEKSSKRFSFDLDLINGEGFPPTSESWYDGYGFVSYVMTETADDWLLETLE